MPFKMDAQKRIGVIEDLSGFGKCSLTVALPVLSAAGLEACAMPTAVLSSHTGGLGECTCRDLTEDLLPFARHWKSLGLHFDALLSGYLASPGQIDRVSEIFTLLKSEDTLLAVDPAMADGGELYRGCLPETAEKMTRLCRRADLIFPNMTEAFFLLGLSFHEGPYTAEEIEGLLKGLCKLGPGRVVLSGVYFSAGQTGAAFYEKGQKNPHYAFASRVEGNYHGTGDLFASLLLSGLLHGLLPEKALRLAVDFTKEAVLRTFLAKGDTRFGLRFEEGLSGLRERIRQA